YHSDLQELACRINQSVELMSSGDAQLGVRAVQVRGDRARGQEQPVGDLVVGEAVAGENSDLALLRGELVKRIRLGRPCLGGHAAGAQLRVGPSGPGGGAKAGERFERRSE